MIKESWVITNKKADFNYLGKKYNIDPVTARVLINRNIPEDSIKPFMTGDFSYLHDPKLMHGLPEAKEMLLASINSHKKIRIMGDYDVDGVCSTYILLKSLIACGANVDAVIPDRIKDGYGININMISQAKEDNIDVILTCDNGIAAKEQIEFANECGIEVILTDHHEIPIDISGEEILPPAAVVVDPHQKTDTYPFAEICGAVVAFKLMQLLLPEFLETQDANILLTGLFEFAALATVCDVMPLIDENRIIVKQSLPRISSSANLGLRALVLASGLAGKEITAFHLGFIIGPCINAAGRLKNAKMALDLFTEEDPQKAEEKAYELVKLNEKRRSISAVFEEKAFEFIEAERLYDNEVIILHLSGCHESLAGIIAGRVKEKYCRPAVILTDDAKGLLKGSGRSTDDFDMFARFSEHKYLFEKFGGHKAAAGLSITKENYKKFKEIYCVRAKEDPVKKIVIDVPMPLSYCSLPLANEFKQLEPFGNGNSKPLFAEAGLKLIGISKMGQNGSAAKLSLLDKNDKMFTAVYFGDLTDFNKKIAGDNSSYEVDMLYENISNNDFIVDVAYNLDTNSFRGKAEPQIVIKHIRRRIECAH